MLIAEEEKESKLRHELDMIEEMKEKNKKKKNKEALIDELVMHCFSILILTLLEPKVVSLCHQYKARPTCTSVLSSSHLDKMVMDSCKKWKVGYSF